jgi:hypothetical protein
LLIESGETVAVEAVYEGTHTGPLPAVGSRREIPATGRRLCCRTRPCTPCVTGCRQRPELLGRARDARPARADADVAGPRRAHTVWATALDGRHLLWRDRALARERPGVGARHGRTR